MRPCVYVVDDDAALRRTITRMLNAADITSEEFESAESFLKGYSTRPAGCVLLDVRLPGMNGIDLLERISALTPPNPIIMLSGYGDVPTAVKAVQTGALDFLQKPFAKDDLIRVVQRGFDRIEVQSEAHGKIAELTPREIEVLQAFSDGAANKVVAARLDLSPRTVEMHRARIFKKLDVANLPQALARAREAGLVG